MLLHVVRPVAGLAIVPDLAHHGRRAVVAHQGHERTPLHPAHHQFLGVGALGVVAEVPAEEAAEVGVPHRDAADHVVEARRHLVLHVGPVAHDVAAPRECAVVLDAERSRTRHLQLSLGVALRGTLVLVDAAVVNQREGILHAAPRAVVGHVVRITLPLEVVGFGRIGPPRIEAHAVEVGEIFPVDVARLGVEHVIDQHATVAGPGVERKEGTQLVEFLVLPGPGSEVGPEGDHQVGILPVHVVHHLLRRGQARGALCLRLGNLGIGILVVGKVTHLLRVANLVEVMGVLELHGVPVRVATPVLPVLHDGVDGDVAAAVFVEHARKLVGCLVALAALPVAVRPEREHRRLAAQPPYLLHHAVLRAVLVEEVVVDALADAAAQGGPAGIVAPERLSCIVPIDAVALLAGEVGDVDVRIGVPKAERRAALVDGLSLAALSEAEDGFVGVELPALAHFVLAPIDALGDTFHGALSQFGQQLPALGVEEAHHALGIDLHRQTFGREGALAGDGRCRVGWRQYHRITPFRCHRVGSSRSVGFRDAHDAGGI